MTLAITFLISGAAGLVVGRLLAAVGGGELGRVSFLAGLRACPDCGCATRTGGLLPLWWWIGGHRCCASPAWRMLRAVEPITVVAMVGTTWLLGVDWYLVAYAWMVAITIVLSFVDLGSRRLPNRITLPGAAIGLLLLAGASVLEGQAEALSGALWSGLGYFGGLGVLAVLTRGALGMGDVKLGLLLGLFTGYYGWDVTVTAVTGAFVLGGAVGLVLLAARRVSRHDYLPFGPFMVAGAWSAIALASVAGTAPVA